MKLPIPIALPTLDAYKHAFWTAAVVCIVAGAVPFLIRTVRPTTAVASGNTTADLSSGREPVKTDA